MSFDDLREVSREIEFDLVDQGPGLPPLLVEVEVVTLVPKDPPPGTEGDCSVVYRAPAPYIYWSGGASARAYGELDVSAGCASSVNWEHRLQEKQWIVWTTRGSPYHGTDDPGGPPDYDTRSWGCVSTQTSEDWRNEIKNQAVGYAVLTCEG